MPTAEPKHKVTRMSLDGLGLGQLALAEDFLWWVIQRGENALSFSPVRALYLRPARLTYLWLGEEIVRRCDALMAEQKGEWWQE